MASNHCRGRCFHHYAHFNALVKGFAFFTQLRFQRFQLALQIAHFFHRDDHREHDAQFTESRSTQDGAQLSVQDFPAVHRDTDRAPAQERVLFFWQVHVGQFFVAADVHGTDDDCL
ncbi:hypothetical protein D3C76_1517910 [compost metagenome]